ncbi:MAG: heme exporter protein CcmB [Alphaproteobacteria bacterium]|nr:heme exporter protein CcmB [Alphaproteobacteria bacterium]MCB9930664.1 heme exporter protein CcmB [Alphaproteobacteria bacterium]
MSGFLAILARDLKLARAESGGALLAVQFFALGALLFPLGLGPEPAMLSRIGGGLLAVMALLATLLALDRLFQQDHEDGTLDLLLTAPTPLWSLVMGKTLAHWLLTGGPMIVAAPVLGILLQMSWPAIAGLVVALALGTPTLSLVGAIGASLTLGARRGGVLLALLVLPLYIPVLIFMSGTVTAAETGLAFGAHVSILGALLLLSLVLAPWAAAVALRQTGE